MPDFKFRRLSKEFVGELLEDIANRRFVVVLGPPYSGKTLLLRQLAESQLAQPYVTFHFETEAPTRIEEDVRKTILSAVQTALPDSTIECNGPNLLTPLRSALHVSQTPLIVFGRSVDGLSYQLCRRLLSELNELWSEGLIIPIVTGEFGLLDLVYGGNAALNSPTLYMNQGFDEDSFKLVTNRYLQLANGLGIKVSPTVHTTLFNITHGNDSLVGWIFWALLERGIGKKTHDAIVSDEAIEAIAVDVAEKGVRAAHTFIRADWLLSRRPECWRDLEDLRALDGVPIATHEPPGPLEFSGLAVREQGRLVPASRMVTIFLAKHYTALHLADLAARSGHWTEAFERYKQLGPVAPRPSDVVDWREAASNMSAFTSYLRSIDDSLESLVGTFVNGCKFLLGLREVLYFERKDFDGWQLHPWSTNVSKSTEEVIASLLPRGECPSGQYRSPMEYEQSVLGWVMQGEREERQVLVLVADGVESGKVIGPERRQLATQLLAGFANAHSRVTKLDRDLATTTLQNSYARIFRELVGELASRPSALSVKELVVSCAGKLKALRYRRVMFSLVSPDGAKIQGFHDECDQSSVRVDRLTDWDLALPSRDLQPWVVVNKNAVRVPDASREPMANQKVIKMARMKAIAIVPIIISEGESDRVIGTIHIERSDSLLPSSAEVKTLQNFGSQFGTLLELQQRMLQLEAVVEKTDIPVVLSNARMKIRYLNMPAATLLGISDWKAARQDGLSIDQRDLKEHLLAACTGKEHSQRWTPEKRLTEYFIKTKTIGDRDNRLLGAIAFFNRVELNPEPSHILCSVAQAGSLDDALELAVRFAKSLKRKWARVWKIDCGDPARFVYHEGFTSTTQFEGTNYLKSVELSRKGSRGFETWEAVEGKRPMVFRYDPDGLTGSEAYSPGGVRYTIIASSCCPSEIAKGPGEYWLDIPLIGSTSKEIGKLTVQWDENDPKELFELTGCMTEIFAARPWNSKE